jgi:hypothetical protein
MTLDQETAIKAWLARIGETDPVMINDVLVRCSTDRVALKYFMSRATEVWYDR